jgi:hypothetical protein
MSAGQYKDRQIKEAVKHVSVMTFFWPLILIISGLVRGFYGVLTVGLTAVITTLLLGVFIVREPNRRIKIGKLLLGFTTSSVLLVWYSYLTGGLNVFVSVFSVVLLYAFGFFGSVYILVP